MILYLFYAMIHLHGFFILSVNKKNRLKKIQRAATKIIYPDFKYEDRMKLLSMGALSNRIFDLSKAH